MAVERDEVLVPDVAGWHDWLVANHDTSPGVWLVLSRKGGTVTSLTYEDAVLEAVAFGWIDSQARRRDEESTFITMTPRSRRSPWSQSNVARVARLESEGRMQPSGRAAVEAARADGRWPSSE